jgi:integrase/recombinase XerD
MLEQGTSIRRMRSIATMLLHVIRLMNLKELRPVELPEIQDAAMRWLCDVEARSRNGKPKSVALFTYLTIKWFRFHNVFSAQSNRVEPDDSYSEQFVHFIQVVRGMSYATVRAHRLRVRAFLKWNTVRKRSLAQVTLDDIDLYVRSKLEAGYLPRSIASVCCALRVFFQFAEMKAWNRSNIAKSIYRPRIPRFDPEPKGPLWSDVRRLLDHDFGSGPANVRAAAITALAAIYALRSSEIVNLKLGDFDWHNEILTIRRAKNGRIQHFPIQIEVGDKVIRYLKEVRPQCKHRNLFVSIKPPYRPMDTTILWVVVANRLKALGILSRNYGVHALRHSCATQLLHEGSSLPAIADFLGHRDLTSVSVYAKHDIESLRRVSDFDLHGVI